MWRCRATVKLRSPGIFSGGYERIRRERMDNVSPEFPKSSFSRPAIHSILSRGRLTIDFRSAAIPRNAMIRVAGVNYHAGTRTHASL